MELRNGFRYVTRDGQTSEPVSVPPKESNWTGCVVADGMAAGCLQGWCSGGAYRTDRKPHPLDLVAEAPGNPVLVTVTHSGWLHGWRVLRNRMDMTALPVTITYDTRNGVVDLSTYRLTPREIGGAS